MVDITDDVLQQLADSTGLAVDSIKPFTDALVKLTLPKEINDFIETGLPLLAKTLGKTTDEVTKLKKGFTDLAKELANPLEIIKKFNLDQFLNHISDSTAKLAKDLHIDTNNIKDSVTQIGLGFVIPGLAQTSKVFDAIGDGAKGGQFQLATMADSYGKMIGKTAEYAGKVLAAADSQRNFERGTINLAASTGNFDKALTSLTSSIQAGDQSAADWSRTVTTVAAASGMSSEAVSKLYGAFLLIPNAMKEINTGATVQGLSLFDASLKVAAVTGEDAGVVFAEMGRQVEDLGGTTEHAIGVMSEMSAVSNQLTLPFQDLNKYVTSTTTALQEFGNTAEGNLRVLSALGPAAEKVGLSNYMVGKLSEDAVKGIGKMNEAQEALLSSRSGGPGGLRGSAIEEGKLLNGKTDEVFNQQIASLKKQLGGKFLDYNDAQKSDDAARQYSYQKKLMQSSQFGNLATDNASAAQLSRILKEGITAPTKEMMDPQAATKKAIASGSQLQERGNHILGNIDAHLQDLVAQGATGAGKIARVIGGSESDTMKDLQRVENERLQRIKHQSPILGTGEKRGPQAYDNARRNFLESKDDTLAVVKGAGTVAKDIIDVGIDAAHAFISPDTLTPGEVAARSAKNNINNSANIQKKMSTDKAGHKTITVDVNNYQECPDCLKKHLVKHTRKEVDDAIKDNDEKTTNQHQAVQY